MIFLVSVVLSLAYFSCRLCFILELKAERGSFFQRFHLYIWAIGGHELGILSIRVHNSLTVQDNSWALKFDNFSEFRNVISDSTPNPQRHYGALRTKIDMWLTPRRKYRLPLFKSRGGGKITSSILIFCF